MILMTNICIRYVSISDHCNLYIFINNFKVKNLEQKDEAEEEAKLLLRAQAKQELDDWYKQHAEQVSQVIE